MTPAEHIAAAVAALDAARRALEPLESSPCGDDDVDEIISAAVEEIEANIVALHYFSTECV